MYIYSRFRKGAGIKMSSKLFFHLGKMIWLCGVDYVLGENFLNGKYTVDLNTAFNSIFRNKFDNNNLRITRLYTTFKYLYKLNSTKQRKIHDKV